MKNRLLPFVLMLLLPALAVAGAEFPVQDIAVTDKEMNTVWVVGNYQIIADGFNAIAMFFGKDSIFMSLFGLGALIAFATALASFIGKMKLELWTYFLTTICFAILFLPRTDLYVASYYGNGGSAAAGAVAFRKVDNVPIGLVYPMALFSNIGKNITETYDTSFTLLSDTQITGGPSIQGKSFLVHGAEGFFSPLRVSIRLANRFSPSDEFWGENLREGFEKCNWADRNDSFRKYGTFGVLWPDDNKITNTSVMQYKFRDSAGAVITRSVTCKVGGYIMGIQLLADTVPEAGKAYSYAGKVAAATSKMTSASDINHALNKTAYLARADEEAKELPKMLSTAINGNEIPVPSGVGNPKTLLTTLFKDLENGKQDKIKVAQSMLAKNEVDTATIQASMMVNNLVAGCFSERSRSCGQYTLMMTEARNKAAVDSAGEASLFQKFFGHVMNILLFVYVAMAPIIMFVIVVMGVKGWRLVFGYLLFCGWISSWLPLVNAIGYYMMRNYINAIHRISTGLEKTNPESVWTIASPDMINQILAETQDMIATGSTMMTAAPTLMLILLSGSPYALASLAQRAGMTNKDYMNENHVTPSLDQNKAVNLGGHMSNLAGTNNGYVDQNVLTNMSNVDMNAGAKISLMNADSSAVSAAESLSRNRSAEASITQGNVLTTQWQDSEGNTRSAVLSVQNGKTQVVSDRDAISEVMKRDDTSVFTLSGGVGGALPKVKILKLSGDISEKQAKSMTMGINGEIATNESLQKAISTGNTQNITFGHTKVDSESFNRAQQDAVKEIQQENSQLSATMQRSSNYSVGSEITQPVLSSYIEQASNERGWNSVRDEIAQNYYANGLKQQGDMIANMNEEDKSRMAQVLIANYQDTGDGGRVRATTAMALHDVYTSAGMGYSAPAQQLEESVKIASALGMVESGAKYVGLNPVESANTRTYSQPLDANRGGQGVVDMRSDHVSAASSRFGARMQQQNAGIAAAIDGKNDEILNDYNKMHNEAENRSRDTQHHYSKDLIDTSTVMKSLGLADSDEQAHREQIADEFYAKYPDMRPNILKEGANAIGLWTESDVKKVAAKNEYEREKMMEKGYDAKLIDTIKRGDSTANVYEYRLNMDTDEGRRMAQGYQLNREMGRGGEYHALGVKPQTPEERQAISNIFSGTIRPPGTEDYKGASRMGKRRDGSAFADPSATGSYLSQHKGWRRASDWALAQTREKSLIAGGRDLNDEPGTQANYCGQGVRKMLQEANLLKKGKFGDAPDLFKHIQKQKGWNVVATGVAKDIQGSIDGFKPKDGMIAFIEPTEKREYGHIAMWVQAADNGRGAWISDYYQGKNLLSSKTYKDYVANGSKITVIDNDAIRQEREFSPARENKGFNFGFVGAGNVAKMSASQKDNMMSVYQAARNNGLSHSQAAILTSEIGRENDYGNHMFGTHRDPAKGHLVNGGIISWNGSRKAALDRWMEARGLSDGKGGYKQGQKSLDAQVAFALHEMRHNKAYARTKREFLDNPNVTYDKGKEVLGTNYIAWRYNDPKYSNGHRRRDGYMNALNSELKRQGRA